MRSIYARFETNTRAYISSYAPCTHTYIHTYFTIYTLCHGRLRAIYQILGQHRREYICLYSYKAKSRACGSHSTCTTCAARFTETDAAGIPKSVKHIDTQSLARYDSNMHQMSVDHVVAAPEHACQSKMHHSKHLYIATHIHV